MFLPLSDAPNPQGAPVVTWTLIALNVVAYLFINVPFGAQPADVNDPAYGEYLRFLSQIVQSEREFDFARQQISAYDLFVFKYGYRPAQSSILDLFFAMFLHGGLLHLVGNMLFLWIYGDNVEHRLGRVWFVVWYLLTGVAATLFHAMFFPSSQVPLIGASGAISGVLGFYFIWFPKNMVRMLILIPPFFVHTIEIAARIVLAIYLFLDNIVPFLFAGAGGVAHGAHIGGFVAGALAALVMNRRAVEARPKDAARPKTVPTGAESVRAALSRGDLDEAAAEFLELPAGPGRGVLSPDEAVTLANRLRAEGHSQAALVLLQRVIRSAPRSPGMAAAYALGGTILLEDRRDATAAYQYLMAALKAGPDTATRAAIDRGLAAIEAAQRVHLGRFQRRR
jgi:membrane associated rhomboid family serine protease